MKVYDSYQLLLQVRITIPSVREAINSTLKK